MRLVDDSSSGEERGDSKITYMLNGEEAFLVREIRDDRVNRKRKEYLVVWEGYDSTEASWVPATDVNLEARKAYISKKVKKS